MNRNLLAGFFLLVGAAVPLLLTFVAPAADGSFSWCLYFILIPIAPFVALAIAAVAKREGYRFRATGLIITAAAAVIGLMIPDLLWYRTYGGGSGGGGTDFSVAIAFLTVPVYVPLIVMFGLGFSTPPPPRTHQVTLRSARNSMSS